MTMVLCDMKGCTELTDHPSCVCDDCRTYIINKMQGTLPLQPPVEERPTYLSTIWKILPKVANPEKRLTSFGEFHEDGVREIVAILNREAELEET